VPGVCRTGVFRGTDRKVNSDVEQAARADDRQHEQYNFVIYSGARVRAAPGSDDPSVLYRDEPGICDMAKQTVHQILVDVT